MPKVYGVREIELRPEADPEEFEALCRAELLADLSLDGFSARLLRGDRGSRNGRYALLFEIESKEVRDRHFPGHDQPSEEVAQWLGEHPTALQVLEPGEFVAAVHDTDYLDISDVAILI